MIKGEAEIILSQFVYEELCNHIQEDGPKDKITGRSINKSIISKEMLFNFTKYCTLSFTMDKDLSDYMANMAYLLRVGNDKVETPIKNTIIKSLNRNLENEGKIGEPFKKDISSCGKYSDSLIAVYSNLAGIYFLTANIDDFIGKGIEPWNGEGDIKYTGKKSNLFKELTMSDINIENLHKIINPEILKELKKK